MAFVFGAGRVQSLAVSVLWMMHHRCEQNAEVSLAVLKDRSRSLYLLNGPRVGIRSVHRDAYSGRKLCLCHR